MADFGCYEAAAGEGAGEIGLDPEFRSGVRWGFWPKRGHGFGDGVG